MPSKTLKVDEFNTELRVDVFLTQNLKNFSSRTFVQKLINQGAVTINGKSAKPHDKVSLGDKVHVILPKPERPLEGLAPEAVALDIFYEDETILVVNKPVGMLVHPVSGIASGTLVNALLHHCSSLSHLHSPRPGIVHRLDRETSGLMVVAKNNHAHVHLAKQFEEHKVRKRYVALVKGNVEFEEGMIDVPISRHPVYWDKKAVSYEDSAREAVTTYRVLKRFPGGQATLVALFPQSGRTHQLRVHMNHLGHPILGDDKYGVKGFEGGMRLHAQGLAFIHPTTGCFVEFFCPLPEHFVPKGL